MPEIINEWAGYNGKMTEEKRPDGTVKKTKHHKIWAAALTNTGHIYVRYGPAKHPLKLTEQIIRPRAYLSERDALSEAERVFQEKVREKLYQKGYEAIPFETPPHYVPSFAKWRMSDEPEEVVTTGYEVASQPDMNTVPTLEDALGKLAQHTLIDIGDGQTYQPDMLAASLRGTDEGRAWLAVPCLRRENSLLHAGTEELLACVIDAFGQTPSPEV